MVFEELKKKKIDVPSKLKRIFLSCIGWTILIPVIIGSIILRKGVDVVLGMKLKNRYGGLYDKRDVVWLMPDVSRCWECSIISVLFIKSQKQTDVFTNFRKTLKRKVFDHPELFPKLTSTMHIFAGYPYWIKNNVAVDEVLKPLQLPEGKCFNEEHLKKIAANISNQPFNKNGTLLWSLHVSTAPLDIKDGFYHYPVVARFQHSIGDGTSLIGVLIELLAENNCNNYAESVFRKLFGNKITHPKVKHSLIKNVNELIKRTYNAFNIALEVIFVSLGNILITDALGSPDKNALKSKTNCYSGQKNLVWYTETYPESIKLLKDIKEKMGTKFMCALITVCLSSVSSYFEKNSLPLPEKLTVIFPIVFNFTDSNISKRIPLENKASPGILSFPPVRKTSSLKQTLKLVSSIMASEIRYSDLLLLKYLWPLLGNMPHNLVKHFGSFVNQTLILTNIPGGSKIDIMDHCFIERIVPFAPVMKGVGISLAIMTYDDRLQIGFTTDKTLISSAQSQIIVDDIVRNIKRLHAECI